MSATARSDPGSEDFAVLADQFRPELLAHCYRMLARSLGPIAPAAREVSWLEPFPDALLRPESADPAAMPPMPTWFRGRENIPDELATGLLAEALVLVPPADRHPLFAAPVLVSPPATPSDRLTAYLGRSQQ